MTEIREDYRYTEDHEWVSEIDKQGHAYIGITDFAQKELGDLVYVDIDSEVKDSVDQEEIFGSIEAVKTVSDLFMPLSATIVEINEKVVEDPEIINNDPYEEGWILRIKVDNPDEYGSLMDNEEYAEKIGQ